MKIDLLTLSHFRNYKDTTLTFDPRHTLLVGLNGSGKTNALEAIAFLSMVKSFRGAKDTDLMEWQAPVTRMVGRGERAGQSLSMSVALDRREQDQVAKTIHINKIKKRLLEAVGTFAVVIFCPEDLHLVAASPGVRRRYLDIMLCGISRTYTEALLAYKKVLVQRNKLLEQMRDGSAGENELSFWNKELLEHGTHIITERISLLTFFEHSLRRAYQEVSGDARPLTLHYAPNISAVSLASTHDHVRTAFADALQAAAREEYARCTTVVGPHRDDVILSLDATPMVSSASRGELRSAILSLKITELEHAAKRIGERPILLLDDIFSELDAPHRDHLVACIAKQQTILTTADAEHVPPALQQGGTVVYITKGLVT